MAAVAVVARGDGGVVDFDTDVRRPLRSSYGGDGGKVDSDAFVRQPLLLPHGGEGKCCGGCPGRHTNLFVRAEEIEGVNRSVESAVAETG